MLPYWSLFLLPALVALNAAPLMRIRPDGTRPIHVDGVWAVVFLTLVAVIGFRYEVGGDWGNYFRYLIAAQDLSFSSLSDLSDPGYWLLNLMSLRLGWGMTGVNVMGAAIFSTGLVVFCRSLPRPWLALACAVPYLIIVVGMGYTRQGLALGLGMVGLVALARRRYFGFVAMILLGAMFHKTAVLLLPIAGLSISTNRLITIPLITIAALLGYMTLLQDQADALIAAYQDENIQSAGALVRLAMNVVPAALLLMLSRRMVMSADERRLWRIFAWLSVGMFGAFFVTSLSTALDRMALYAIPLQLVVFSHLPDALGRRGGRNQLIVLAILLYYSLVMFVWLNFAVHSSKWLPYQMGFA